MTEAIRILATYPIDEVSLDHDIQCHIRAGASVIGPFYNAGDHTSEETFEPVARYIALMNPRPKVQIHTSNYPAGDRMAEILGIEYHWPTEG